MDFDIFYVVLGMHFITWNCFLNVSYHRYRLQALSLKPNLSFLSDDHAVILDIITQAKADGAYDESKIRTEMVGTNNKKVYYEKAQLKKTLSPIMDAIHYYHVVMTV